MVKFKLFVVLALLFTSWSSAAEISLSGTVTDEDGIPLRGASVSLLKAGLFDTTDAEGRFSIVQTGVIGTPPRHLSIQSGECFLRAHTLHVKVNESKHVSLSIYNLQGQRVKTIFNGKLHAGTTGEFSLRNHAPVPNFYLVKLSVGSENRFFSYLKSAGGVQGIARTKGTIKHTAASAAASVDTLTVSAPEHLFKSVPLDSYVKDSILVSLVPGSYVWYAGYGSNLSTERFLCYIVGGKPKYATSSNNGCTNKDLPVDDREISMPYRLYFARYSSKWKGAVCFLSTEKDTANPSLGRMWKITKEQYEEVKKQEGSWYGKQIFLGEEDDIPIYTFTSSKDLEAESKKPSDRYLKTIVEGIRETYPDMSDDAIVDYLISKKGADKYGRAELMEML